MNTGERRDGQEIIMQHTVFRDRAGPRKVLVTVNGVIRDQIRTPQSPASPMAGSVNDF